MNDELSRLVRKLVGNRTLLQVSEQAGIGKSTLAGILSGKYEPSVKILRRLTDSKANPQNGVTFEDLMVAAGYQDDYVDREKESNVYIIYNESNKYSTSVRLTGEQAKAIEWFIEEILEYSGTDYYSISPPEDCPCADLTKGGAE